MTAISSRGKLVSFTSSLVIERSHTCTQCTCTCRYMHMNIVQSYESNCATWKYLYMRNCVIHVMYNIHACVHYLIRSNWPIYWTFTYCMDCELADISAHRVQRVKCLMLHVHCTFVSIREVSSFQVTKFNWDLIYPLTQ